MAKKDTTLKGVSPEASEEQPVETRPMTDDINPRRGAEMSSAVENRKKQIEAEMNEDKAEDDPERIELARPQDEQQGDENQDPERDPEPEPESKAEGDPEPAPEPDDGEEAQAKEAAPDPEPSEPMVTVNIDGEKRQVPVSEISTTVKVNQESHEIGGKDLVDGFQMAAAGQARLREANQRLAAAERKEQENKRTEPTAPEADDKDGGEEEKSAEGLSDHQALDLAKKLQFGDESEAAEALREIVKMREGRGDGAATPTPDEIADAAASRAADMTEQRLRYKDDLKTIGEEYPHIINDENLMANAVNNVHKIRAYDLQRLGYNLEGSNVADWVKAHEFEQGRGTVRSNLELFRMAGEATNEWIKSFGGAVPSPSAEQPSQKKNGFAEKREAKRTTAAPPRATGAVTTGSKPDKKPLSGAEKVLQMRQSRGQPVAS